MNFSIFTFLMSFLIAAVLISSLNIWLKRSLYVITYWPGVLLAILLLPLFRLLVAVEFPFTHEVTSDTVYPVIYKLLTSSAMSVAGYSLSVMIIFVMVWLLGAALCLAKEINQYRKVVVSFRHISPLRNTKETDMVNEILLSRGSRRKDVRVIRTSCVVEPMIYGVIHPIIVLPDQQLDNRELKEIISHELGHYLHGDLMLKWGLEGICALYWWFPLIRLLKKNMYYIMEIRADRFAIGGQSQQKRIDYMGTLLKICQQKQNQIQVMPIAIPLFTYGDNSMIKQRFQAIIHMELRSAAKSKYRSIVLAIIVCVAIFISYTFVLQPRYEMPPTDSDAFEIDADTFYWIPNVDSGYDLYSIDGEHMGWVLEIQGDLIKIPIYYNSINKFEEDSK